MNHSFSLWNTTFWLQHHENAALKTPHIQKAHLDWHERNIYIGVENAVWKNYHLTQRMCAKNSAEKMKILMVTIKA